MFIMFIMVALLCVITAWSTRQSFPCEGEAVVVECLWSLRNIGNGSCTCLPECFFASFIVPHASAAACMSFTPSTSGHIFIIPWSVKTTSAQWHPPNGMCDCVGYLLPFMWCLCRCQAPLTLLVYAGEHVWPVLGEWRVTIDLNCIARI